jgi:dUTP pyrophosphatase
MIGLTAPFIAVTGTIGTGKSTLVRKVGEALQLPTFPEPVDQNPYFGPPDRLALQSELWFLNASLRACREASGHQGGVVERLPAEHLQVFARYRFEQGWLDQGEMDLLEETYAASGSFPREPDLIVHLELGPDEALDRINRRQRPGEKDLDVGYLEALEPLYSSFLRRWTHAPVLRVYTDKLDFHDESDFELVLADIKTRLERQLPVELAPDARLPRRAYPGDGGLDLASAIDADIGPLERRKVPTGVSMHIPEGHVGLIAPRSGNAHEHGITHLDGPGVIDAGYRRQVHLLLYNTDKEKTFHLKAGEYLGQIVIVPFGASGDAGAHALGARISRLRLKLERRVPIASPGKPCG